MKKSEMLDRMTREWMALHVFEEISDKAAYEIIHENMTRLLAMQEYYGMLPPFISGVYDTVPTVTPTGNLDYSYKRGWEPEDEVL